LLAEVSKVVALASFRPRSRDVAMPANDDNAAATEALHARPALE